MGSILIGINFINLYVSTVFYVILFAVDTRLFWGVTDRICYIVYACTRVAIH